MVYWVNQKVSVHKKMEIAEVEEMIGDRSCRALQVVLKILIFAECHGTKRANGGFRRMPHP